MMFVFFFFQAKDGIRVVAVTGVQTCALPITAPLRSRFGIVHRLDFYEPEDLLIIIHRSAKILNIEMDEGGGEEIARRCRGTPRIANRLLRRSRDFAEEIGRASCRERV